jgi:hypothetical protein
LWPKWGANPYAAETGGSRRRNCVPDEEVGSTGNTRRWRLQWEVVVARVCTNDCPVAWSGELTVVASLADDCGIEWPAGELRRADGTTRL